MTGSQRVQTTAASVSDETLRRLVSDAGTLSTTAIGLIEASHAWFRELAPEDRSWVGLVAQAGIGSFIAWLRDPSPTKVVQADVFGTAPRELTRSISLSRTLDLVRSVVDVVEEDAGALAAPGDEQALREAVLRYSREIAFAAAQVYAQAAETRGAWDARLEALVVDAVLRGEADDSLRSRAAALGWDAVHHVTVVAGANPRVAGGPRGDSTSTIDTLRKAADQHSVELLAGVQGRRLVLILGDTSQPAQVADLLAAHFGDGPIVLGPTVPHLFAAGRSARAALSGLGAARAWPQAPRVVSAAALLPERVLAGDDHARRALVDRVHRPLAEAGGALLLTAETYLAEATLEHTARVLFVHPNTVRYRLTRIAQVCGLDLTDPRAAYTAQVALALGRLAVPQAASWRSPR
ncbi:helix-turn-helix domain-containing protein [Arsenicicoccus piscis]|nr:helix-turn-helix domain-containing protein [Arsenicicoccus piscis]MCH8628442.1 helix-turn-helix domain-containing protein [Arsenicicoccus piscis]